MEGRRRAGVIAESSRCESVHGERGASFGHEFRHHAPEYWAEREAAAHAGGNVEGLMMRRASEIGQRVRRDPLVTRPMPQQVDPPQRWNDADREPDVVQE